MPNITIVNATKHRLIMDLTHEEGCILMAMMQNALREDETIDEQEIRFAIFNALFEKGCRL